MSERALIVVDLQNGFTPYRDGLPGSGELGVPGAEEIIPNVNRLLGKFAALGYTTATTQDYHPEVTAHFSDTPNFTTTWPRHCVGGTPGAELHPDLDIPGSTVRFRKGMESLQPGELDTSYSGHTATDPNTGTSLPAYLKLHGVREVDVTGVATDYCVRATAIDHLVKAGLRVNIVTDAISGVAEQSTAAAMAEMAALGIRMVTTDQVLAELDRR